ncbi:MAG: hypothetical protein U9Q82_01990 [Chloroflexota bacterium]|nr:hypothetical protein [Chloroflexota bacterium]
MSLWKKITSFFTASHFDKVYWFYVHCDHCGEVLKARVDMSNDLSVRYGERKTDDTYFCRRVIIGSNRCYQPIEVELTFGSKRELLDRQISGGEFVDEEAYLSAMAEADKAPK